MTPLRLSGRAKRRGIPTTKIPRPPIRTTKPDAVLSANVSPSNQIRGRALQGAASGKWIPLGETPIGIGTIGNRTKMIEVQCGIESKLG